MKKIMILFVVLLSGFLIWYLAIKPYDYLVTFKVKANVGTVNQSLKLWNSTLKNNTPLKQEKMTQLTQQIKVSDSIHIYKWYIKSLNDSVSKVKVYIKDINNSFQNKISTPFGTTVFEQRAKRTVTDFYNKLKEHLNKIKIFIEGVSQTKSTYCAYVSLKGKQFEKAKEMMNNYSLLNTVLFQQGVKSNGTPFIEITNWSIEKDSIEYNFCFPIVKKDSLPIHESIKYKKYNGVKAIKAIYNGNYITSDRAWYQLLDYAKRKNIKVYNRPLEIFFSNPNYGGNELEWIAEIYMPLKE